jgi:3-demethoxyubiquinol 3-hydroxylase
MSQHALNRPCTSIRQPSPLDKLVTGFDRILKSALGPHPTTRPYPAAGIPDSVTDLAVKKKTAGLMRVNHAGEICAQALYHGQASVARSESVREALHQSAQEESDHLAWCAYRLNELGDRPSLLDPLWYAGSFAIGALAGLTGDRHSLGFVAETENQVIEHLTSHLERLPGNDARTRAIIEQMVADEARHGTDALQKGGELPPTTIKRVMKLTAKIMTKTSEYI